MAVQSSTNLIINYLPQSLTDDEFRSMFLSIGPLKASKIIRDRATNYSYGFGFVDYANEDDAAKAIATLNGLQLQNKKIKVAYSRNHDKVKGANLYIKGLPINMGEVELQQMFERFGSIIQVRVIYDQTSGQSKGVGFVLYDTKDEAESARQAMDGAQPEGVTQPLVVKFAEDNATKARPSAPGAQQQGNFAIPTRGGYTARGGIARGGGAGMAGPMRRGGGGMNRYNPMGGSASYGGAGVAGYGAYGYDESGYGTMPQNGSGDGGFVLFVYNIGPDADESALWQLFSPFGSVTKVNVIKDFQKNVGKGYGFVTMSNYAEAMNAIQQLNGYKYYGKPLQVSFKQPK